MDSSSKDSSTPQSMAPSDQSSSGRSKSDIAWNHVSQTFVDGKNVLTCLYCGFSGKGGGIYRMKQHLAGKKGQVRPCSRVPPDVKFQMENSLGDIAKKKRENQDRFDVDNPYGPSVAQFEGDNDVQEISNPNVNFHGKSKFNMPQTGKENASGKIGDYFAPRTTVGSQPTLKSVLASKEAIHRAHMEVAKFFYDSCLPINAANSMYFQRMFDAACAIGSGFKVPSYHQLIVSLLNDAKKEVQLFVDSMKNEWEKLGCTIMGDGWTDNRQRTLINFLVYCPRGTVFLRSVDASDVVKNAETLFGLFKEVIEWVGPANVVHMVTDNGANYVAAGRLVSAAYPSISWSPCAAHCLNLVMQDISKLDHVKILAEKGSAITKFVYNHGFWLSWLRKRKDWTEIVRPGATRFATTFIALNNVYQHMHDLKALVTCKEFCDSKLYKEKKIKDVVAIILDNKFWNDCHIIVKIVAPLMRLLRIVDGDTKPSLGYVFDGMRRARKAIKMLFHQKKKYYKVYTTIIKRMWDMHLKKSIHAAAYWLNPAFQYDRQNFCDKTYVMDGLIEVITKKTKDSWNTLLQENGLFRDQLSSFGSDAAKQTYNTLPPDEWWKMFGHGAPNLKNLAIRILGQTSSSSGCERNWSVFERIHTKKRNRLEHQRLNDLVFVHYNLKLKNRLLYKEKSFDPIDYESIDATDYWILEDVEDEPSSNIEEIEKMLYEELEEPRLQRQRRREREGDDHGDDFFMVEDMGDDIDFSSMDEFAYESQLVDVDVGVGTSGASNNNDNDACDDESWLRDI